MKIRFPELILYEDDHFIVINKPPFIASLADRNDPRHIQLLARKYHVNSSVCHRLDKETSGCLLIAKDQASYRHASVQFEKRSVRKVYHAVAEGLHRFTEETVTLPILPLASGVAKIDHKKGREAKTIFNTIETYQKHTLIECIPVSGRMHQIRVHLSSQKAPLVNDSLYGGEPLYLSAIKKKFNLKKETEERPLIRRFALHALQLSFHNFSRQVTIEADYPKDFRVLLKQLRKTAH